MKENETIEKDVLEFDIETEGAPGVTPATIARTVVFVAAWINQLFVFLGLPTFDFDPDATYLAVSLVATFLASTAGFWFNNSFTLAARLADMVKNVLKGTPDAAEGE